MYDFIYSTFDPNVVTTLIKEELDNFIVTKRMIENNFYTTELKYIPMEDYIRIYGDGIVDIEAGYPKYYILDLPFDTTIFSEDIFKIVIEVISITISYEMNTYDISNIFKSNELAFNHFIESIYQTIMDDIHSELLNIYRYYNILDKENIIYDISKTIYKFLVEIDECTVLPYYWLNDNRLIYIGRE